MARPIGSTDGMHTLTSGGDGRNERNMKIINNLGRNFDHNYSLTDLDNWEKVENNNSEREEVKLSAKGEAKNVDENTTCEIGEEVDTMFEFRKEMLETSGILEFEMKCNDQDLSDKENICDSRTWSVVKDPTARWTDFILYSTLVIADVKNKFNPYLADAQDAVNFLSCYRRRYFWDYQTLAAYMKTLAKSVPGLHMEDMQTMVVDENTIKRIVRSPIMKRSFAPYKVTWTKFLEFCYKKDFDMNPFFANPEFVRDFLISKFKGRELREIPRSEFFEPSHKFYSDNLSRICGELDWYLKTSLCHKPLLETEEIAELMLAARNRDEGVVTDKLAVRLTPDYHFCKYSLAGVTSAFWLSKLTKDVLTDINNGAIETEAAAKELGITKEMVNAGIASTEKLEAEFVETLSLREYLEQGYGIRDSFWKEESIMKMLEEVNIKKTAVDAVAVKLGVARREVVEKCAGVSGNIKPLNNNEDLCSLDTKGNKPKSDLEIQIEISEKRLESLSEYEKMRLNNMKERLKLLEMLDFDEDKTALRLKTNKGAGNNQGKSDKPVLTLRKPSARIKRLGESKKFKSNKKKGDSQRFGMRKRRISPRWFAQWIPRDQLKCLVIPIPPVDLKVTELLDGAQNFRTGVTMMDSITSEVKTLAVEIKWEEKVDFGSLGVEHDSIISDSRLTSLDSHHDLICYGTSSGGVGIFLSGRSVTFQPHSQAVSRTVFWGGHSSLSVLSAGMDGVVRLTDLAKQVVIMKYSWDQASNTKHKVYWMEEENNNSSLLLHCGQDIKRLDVRDRRAHSVISLKNWREDESRMVGTNISVHPKQATLLSVCASEGVKIWDMRNTTSHVELISQGISARTQTGHTMCGAMWSPTGQYMMVAKRITEEHSKFSLTYSNIPTVFMENYFSNPLLSWTHAMDVSYSPLYGVNWCPWDQENPTFLTTAKLPTVKSRAGLGQLQSGESQYKVVAVDAISGEVVGQLDKELDNTCYLVHCHNTRQEVLVGNSRGDGVLAVFKAGELGS